MKKRYFIVTLILLFILSLINVSFATGEATASFVPDKLEAKKEEYVTLTFSISTQGDFNGFEGYLIYDTDFFTDVSVNSSYTINEGRGFSGSLIGIETTDIIPSGTLFTVRLKVNESTTKESGDISLSEAVLYTPSNSNDDDCELSVSPITITLIKAEEQGENNGGQQESGGNQGEPGNQPEGNEEQQTNNVTNQSQSGASNTNQNTSSNTSQNTSPKQIPNTGKDTIIIAAIVIVAILGTVAIIKFRNVIK